MKIIGYITEENKTLYDFDTMRKLLGTSRSKLHREIKKNRLRGTKYKNQYLYNEYSLFTLMENLIFDKLNKEENGLRENK